MTETWIIIVSWLALQLPLAMFVGKSIKWRMGQAQPVVTVMAIGQTFSGLPQQPICRP